MNTLPTENESNDFVEAIISDDVVKVEAELLRDASRVNLPLCIQGITMHPLAIAVMARAPKTFHHLLNNVRECDVNQSLAAYYCVKFRRFHYLIDITLSSRWDPDGVHPQSGDTVLHALCRFQRPNVSLARHVITQRNASVHIKNKDGLTPLCLVAQCSCGVDGRQMALLLLAHGAHRTESLERITNLFLRHAVSISGGVVRHNPTLPKEIEKELDAVPDATKLPDITHRLLQHFGADVSTDRDSNFTTPSPTKLSPIHRQRYGVSPQSKGSLSLDSPSGRRMSRNTLEQSIARLYSHGAPRSQIEWENHVARHQRDHPPKVLTPSQLEEMKTRLYEEARETTLEHMMMQEQRYAPCTSPPLQLPEDALRESVYRLHVEGLKAKEKARSDALKKHVLDKEAGIVEPPRVSKSRKVSNVPKYRPPARSPSPPRQLTKLEAEALAVRLHNTSMEEIAKVHEQLSDNYASRSKGRFDGSKVLTMEQWKAMGERLARRGR